MLVNYSEDVYRQRFSAAHEMAHAIFDSQEGPSLSFYRYKGDDLRARERVRFLLAFASL